MNGRKILWKGALVCAGFIVVALLIPTKWLGAQMKPAEADFDIRAHYTKYEYRIPMRDGIKLFTSVYVPKDSSQTYPFLLNRTPYSIPPYSVDQYRKKLGPSPSFARDGFIFVDQDVRGRYMSEGTFVFEKPINENRKSSQDVDESTDTYDTIEWLLHHVPNNNGKAGIWGISFPGYFAAAGAVDSHPALKAASPQAPVADLYMGDDMYHNGAMMLEANFGFLTFFQPRTEIAPPSQDHEHFEYGTTDGYEFYLHMGPLAKANQKYLGGKNHYWDELVAHTTYDQYWKDRNLGAHMKNVHCAILAVGGWFDAEDLAGPFNIFHSVAKLDPDTSDKLVEGPWVHGGWAGTEGDHLGDVDFAMKNSAFYADHILLPFFQQHLKDAEDAKLPTAYVFETGRNVWRKYDAWPPPNTEKKLLYLHGNGKLSFEPPSESTAAFDEYVSDPNHPVPFTETPSLGVPQTYMDADQRFAAKRGDVLVYESAPLETDITVSGPVLPRLWVATSGTDSDFDVKLIDVYPMDYPNPNPNAKGVVMGGYQQLVRGEPFRGKFRNSFEKPEPFVAGQITPLHIFLQDINHTFQRGHRIMIQIQSTWFPLTDRNPQKFMNIPDAMEADFQKATERVFHTKEHASAIELPVLK